MKRILALLLCLACLLVALVSCVDTPNKPEDTTPTPPATDTPTTDAPPADTPADTPTDTPADTPTTPTPPADPPAEPPVTTMDLSQYTIVYPKKASKNVKDAALRLQESINKKIGGEGIAVISDNEMPKTGYEILIGNTSRPAGKTFYSNGVQSAYLIRNANKTIVIGGFSDALTDLAVDYFEAEYVAKIADGKIPVVVEYTKAVSQTLEITEANATSVKVTYAAGLSGVADDVVNAVKTATGLTLTKKAASASYTYQESVSEIIVGKPDCNELKALGNSFWSDGYSVAIDGKKIILYATTIAEYDKAIAALGEAMEYYSLEGAKGAYFFGDYETRVSTLELIDNLPDVSLAPTSVYPAGDGTYIALYEGVTEQFFNEYKELLTAGGFTQYTATSFNGSDLTVNKNLFATYITDKNSIDLQYHAKGYLNSVDWSSGRPNFGNQFDGGILFVTVSPREGLTLPLTKAPEYTPVNKTQYPTILTQVGFGNYHPNEASNCYIIRLADGSFIIYDASYGNFNNQTPADEIYNILKKQAPDPNNIVIAAWVTTHPHADHMDGLQKFAAKYSNKPEITVKQFVHNFADDTIATEQERANQDIVRLAIKKFGSDVEVVKPHAGNVLYYANVKFNVLYSHENHLQLTGAEHYYGNASSLVMQMVTDSGVKVLFGADSPMDDWYTGSQPFTFGAIAKRYGSFLESDIMTYMHHGLGGGADYDTNQTISPKIILWPITWGKTIQAMKGGTSLLDSGHSRYLTRKTSSGGSPATFNTSTNTWTWTSNYFEEGKLHTTPNDNGVYGYFIADDNIHVVNLDNKNAQGVPTVTVYDTFDAYYAS